MADGVTENASISNLIGNLHLVLTQVQDLHTERQNKGDFSLDIFWLKYCSAVQSVSKEATKFSMVFSQNEEAPCEEDMTGLNRGIEGSILNLVSAYYYLPREQGTTLRKHINKHTVGIVRGMIDLAIKTGNNPGSHLQSTGNIWELCDAVADLPKDNKQTILYVARNCLSLVRDALSEIEQGISENAEEWQNLDIQLDQTESDTNWTEADKKFLSPAVGLVKTANHCVKKLILAIESRGNCECVKNTEELDMVGDIVTTLNSLVDDFVISLFPPLLPLLVLENGEKVAVVIENILNLTKDSHYVSDGDSEWIKFLHMAIKHNMDKLRSNAVTP